MSKTVRQNKTYYITTPIYYPSGQWHIGHCYTTVNCDALARYYKYRGYDVCYSTGNDEHGQKIAKVANEKGVTCQEHVDERAKSVIDLWKKCDVEYDKFVRTTDKQHELAVQKIFQKLYDKGDIYKGKYKGKYCTPCESFWTDSQLIDNCCPDCLRSVIEAQEDCYFFRLSAYSDRIFELLTGTDFLEPRARVNEMVTFIKEGLTDLAVTRTSVEWGVKVPFDSRHSIYVWIDALSNYITLLGYDPDLKVQSDAFNRYWPANLHMVGKEIVRFHAIIWPAILMALEIPLPKKVFGHGWLLIDGDKMSKSKGNSVDSVFLIDRYGVDAFRYYLLSEIPFGSDGNYTIELYLNKFNTELVNIYGNLVRRTFSMAKQYFDNKIYNSKVNNKDEDDDFLSIIKDTHVFVDENITKLNVSNALSNIFDLIAAANKYIDVTKPWILAKDEQQKSRLMTVLFGLLTCIRVSSALLMPFLTFGPSQVIKAMNIKFDYMKLINYKAVEKYNLNDLDIMYPRIDIQKELEDLRHNI